MNPIELVPFALIAVVMYYFILRPQMNEKREHDALLASLVRGDRVVTASGLHGVIANVADDTVHLEIADRVKIVVDKSTIARRQTAVVPEKQAEKVEKQG